MLLSSGLWILPTSYVRSSDKHGYWQTEAHYEIGSLRYYQDFYDSIPVQDLEMGPKKCREKALVSMKPNLSALTVALLTEDAELLKDLRSVLRAGGAKVVVLTSPIDDTQLSSFIDFTLCTITDATRLAKLKDRRIPCVSTKFLTAYLCKEPPPDIRDYSYNRLWRRKDGSEKSRSPQKKSLLNKDRSTISEVKENVVSEKFYDAAPCSVQEPLQSNVVSQSARDRTDSCERDTCEGCEVEGSRVFTGLAYSNNMTPRQENFSPSGKRSYPFTMRVSPKRRKFVTPEKNKITNYFHIANSSPCDTKIYVNGINPSLNPLDARTSCNGNFSEENVDSSQDVRHNFDENGVNCNGHSTILETIEISDGNENNASPVNFVNDVTNRIDSRGCNGHFTDGKILCSQDARFKLNERLCNGHNVIETIDITDKNEDIIEVCPVNGLRARRKDPKSRTYAKEDPANCIIIEDDYDDNSYIPQENLGNRKDPSQSSHAHVSSISESKILSTSHTQNQIHSETIVIDSDSDVEITSEIPNNEMRPDSSSKCANKVVHTNLKEVITGELVRDNVCDGDDVEICSELSTHREVEETWTYSQLSLINGVEECLPVDSTPIINHGLSPTRDTQFTEPVQSSCNDVDDLLDLGLPSPPVIIQENSQKPFMADCVNDSTLITSFANSSLPEHCLIDTADETPPALLTKENAKSQGVSSQYSEELDLIPISLDDAINAQKEALYAKYNNFWLRMGVSKVPVCALGPPVNCYNLHGAQENGPEMADFDDDYIFAHILKDGFIKSALNFMELRNNTTHYPSVTIVQNLLFNIMNVWNSERTGKIAIQYLQAILNNHPPCAFGMLKYYNQVLFGRVTINEEVDFPDGILWYLFQELEKEIDFKKGNCTEDADECPSTDSAEFISWTCKDGLLLVHRKVPHHVRLSLIFALLELILDIMEADLIVGLAKNSNNLKAYITHKSRPLIASLLWRNSGVIVAGSVNDRCKKFMILCMEVYKLLDGKHRHSMMRMICFMAEAVYASEKDSSPQKFQEIGNDCKYFASTFANIIISELELKERLKFVCLLKPDWLQLYIYYEMFYNISGFHFDVSLSPMVKVFHYLISPENIETSTTYEHVNSNEVKNSEDYQLDNNFVKQASKKNSKGETKLHVACRNNNVVIVKKLLSLQGGVDVNVKDNAGWTPLHEAAFHGSKECLKLLLSYTLPSGVPAVDPFVQNTSGITPLMDAVTRNHLDVAKLLLKFAGKALLPLERDDGKKAADLVTSEEMKIILERAPSEAMYNPVAQLSQDRREQLCIILPYLISSYVKFSQIKNIIKILFKNGGVEKTSRKAGTLEFDVKNLKKDYEAYLSLESTVKGLMKKKRDNHTKDMISRLYWV